MQDHRTLLEVDGSMNDIKGGKEGKKKAGRARKRRKTETCEIATSWDLEGLVVESVTVESYNRDIGQETVVLGGF